MKCYICHEELQGNQRSGLERHIKAVHPWYKCSRVPPSQVRCGFCGRMCSNWIHYFEHCIAFHQRRIWLREALYRGEEKRRQKLVATWREAHVYRAVTMSFASSLLLGKQVKQREGRQWYDRARAVKRVSMEELLSNVVSTLDEEQSDRIRGMKSARNDMEQLDT